MEFKTKLKKQITAKNLFKLVLLVYFGCLLRQAAIPYITNWYIFDLSFLLPFTLGCTLAETIKSLWSHLPDKFFSMPLGPGGINLDNPEPPLDQTFYEVQLANNAIRCNRELGDFIQAAEQCSTVFPNVHLSYQEHMNRLRHKFDKGDRIFLPKNNVSREDATKSLESMIESSRYSVEMITKALNKNTTLHDSKFLCETRGLSLRNSLSRQLALHAQSRRV